MIEKDLSNGINRRAFIQQSSLLALGAGFMGYGADGATGVMLANVVEKYARLTPADNGLDPA